MRKRHELELLQQSRVRDEQRAQDMMDRGDDMVEMGERLKARAAEPRERSQSAGTRELELLEELQE
jgi:hypothetical protein